MEGGRVIERDTQGQQDDSVIKTLPPKSDDPELHPRDPNGRKRELTSQSCPLGATGSP